MKGHGLDFIVSATALVISHHLGIDKAAITSYLGTSQ
jgi:hypothetical protein